MRVCEIEGCTRKHEARGYCNPHYQQFSRTGSPIKNTPKPLQDRFWEKVDKSGTCWLWTSNCNPAGYGSFLIAGKNRVAHRVAYELLVGPIPEGMFLDHICHTTKCVRPDHLRPATPKQNGENRRGAQSNSVTGVRGVTPTRNGKKWRATVLHYKKQHYLGVFESIAEAERAITAKRLELFTHNERDRNAA